MPLIVPTPDEVEAMSWRERQAWAKRMKLTIADARLSRRMLTAEKVSRCRQCGAWQWRGRCRVPHKARP